MDEWTFPELSFVPSFPPDGKTLSAGSGDNQQAAYKAVTDNEVSRGKTCSMLMFLSEIMYTHNGRVSLY